MHTPVSSCVSGHCVVLLRTHCFLDHPNFNRMHSRIFEHYIYVAYIHQLPHADKDKQLLTYDTFQHKCIPLYFIKSYLPLTLKQINIVMYFDPMTQFRINTTGITGKRLGCWYKFMEYSLSHKITLNCTIGRSKNQE